MTREASNANIEIPQLKLNAGNVRFLHIGNIREKYRSTANDLLEIYLNYAETTNIKERIVLINKILTDFRRIAPLLSETTNEITTKSALLKTLSSILIPNSCQQQTGQMFISIKQAIWLLETLIQKINRIKYEDALKIEEKKKIIKKLRLVKQTTICINFANYNYKTQTHNLCILYYIHTASVFNFQSAYDIILDLFHKNKQTTIAKELLYILNAFNGIILDTPSYYRYMQQYSVATQINYTEQKKTISQLGHDIAELNKTLKTIQTTKGNYNEEQLKKYIASLAENVPLSIKEAKEYQFKVMNQLLLLCDYNTESFLITIDRIHANIQTILAQSPLIIVNEQAALSSFEYFYVFILYQRIHKHMYHKNIHNVFKTLAAQHDLYNRLDNLEFVMTFMKIFEEECIRLINSPSYKNPPSYISLNESSFYYDQGIKNTQSKIEIPRIQL